MSSERTLVSPPPREEIPLRQRRIREFVSYLRAERWPLGILLAQLIGAFLLHATHRGHQSLSQADETVHAIVAKHLVQHPLTPTLYEVAALSPNDARAWMQTHIWLHIPPFGLWASAAAMRVLGATPYAYRLPGLLFVLGGMIVTYLLGRRLFGPWVGLVGAAFAGFTPYALLISQGYYFGDSTETPMMLFIPLTVLGIVLAYQHGKLRWLVLAGAAQGICYLDKGALSLAPAGIVVGLLICERLYPQEEGWARLGWRGLATFVGSLAVVAVPYNVYLARAFPQQNSQESHVWLENLVSSVEHWGRPWDYHLTIYLDAMYGPALALLLLVAGTVIAVMAIRRRSRADLVIGIWLVAVYLPLSVSVSKAVPFTYPAIPALGLAVGRLVQLGLGARWLGWRIGMLGLLLGTALATIVLAARLAPFEVNYTLLQSPSLATPASRSLLYRLRPDLYVLGISVIATGMIAGLYWLARRWNNAQGTMPGARLERGLAAVIVVVAIVLLGNYWLRYDVPAVAHIPARYAWLPAPRVGVALHQNTPANATIVARQSDPIGFYHFVVMFWANRDLYSEPDISLPRVCALSRQAAAVNSPFYVVAQARELTGPPTQWRRLSAITNGGWSLYQPQCP